MDFTFSEDFLKQVNVHELKTAFDLYIANISIRSIDCKTLSLGGRFPRKLSIEDKDYLDKLLTAYKEYIIKNEPTRYTYVVLKSKNDMLAFEELEPAKKVSTSVYKVIY